MKLFVVAYLRGLLTPYYKNGTSSRIRENLVLEALSDELDASTLTNSLSADIGFISSIRSENLSGLYDGIYDKICKIRALKEFDKEYFKQDTTTDDKKQSPIKRHKAQTAEELAKLYKILEETGTLDKIANYKKED